MPTFKELSRTHFTEDHATHENVRTGSMQRIADACELMAKDKEKLISDLDYYKRLAEQRSERCNELYKEIKALKAVKTRYYNQLKKLNGKTSS